MCFDKKGLTKEYDLIVGAVGVNSAATKYFMSLNSGYKPPETTKTYICEFHLGHEIVHNHFGNSMHVFLLDLPRLEFGAIVPKGEYVTVVMLGEAIDKHLVNSFLESPEVKSCFPDDFDLSSGASCMCYPKISITSAVQPFADRMVLLGDCATTKLYKNGIGAAYIAAKAAATTVVFQGVSEADFRKGYWSVCKSIDKDNGIGKLIFLITHLIQKWKFTKRGILRMVIKEQLNPKSEKAMSGVLWDTFTGSSTYKNIIKRTLNVPFISRLIWETLLGLIGISNKKLDEKEHAVIQDLGRIYKSDESIIREGEEGDCMYVIQSGTVEIITTKDGKEVQLAELTEGDFFGEMALFEKGVRSSTVRAKGDVRALTVDKTTLLSRIQEDPSMAFHIVQKMSHRLRELNSQLSNIGASDRRNWFSRTIKNAGYDKGRKKKDKADS